MLEGLVPIRKNQVCRVRMVADQLDDSDRTILMDAIGSPMVWNPPALARALNERQVKLPRYHIEKHRSGECEC